MEDTIIKLQIALAEQEHEITNLSDELYAQQKEIAILKRQYAQMLERIQALSEQTADGDSAKEPPPPHY